MDRYIFRNSQGLYSSLYRINNSIFFRDSKSERLVASGSTALFGASLDEDRVSFISMDDKGCIYLSTCKDDMWENREILRCKREYTGEVCFQQTTLEGAPVLFYAMPDENGRITLAMQGPQTNGHRFIDNISGQRSFFFRIKGDYVIYSKNGELGFRRVSSKGQSDFIAIGKRNTETQGYLIDTENNCAYYAAGIKNGFLKRVIYGRFQEDMPYVLQNLWDGQPLKNVLVLKRRGEVFICWSSGASIISASAYSARCVIASSPNIQGGIMKARYISAFKDDEIIAEEVFVSRSRPYQIITPDI